MRTWRPRMADPGNWRYPALYPVPGNLWLGSTEPPSQEPRNRVN
jgi:hypothetical protein